ncbi:FeoB-associated Cys-rich membrane protein [Eubacterium pyruvativorans]|uniref:FeoB-associated Cys-rich membrane protein n=1 Tax=Eubacterium pyruvativorans TaxID=155865 RepID=UPI0013D59864|nr:FeoB-associated Cys-rich membrane protein [Eubacterium pyruvativorans]
MIAWIVSNAGTLLVSAALIGIVTGIIRKMIRDKKQGKSCCGGDCSHCSHCGTGGSCHTNK